LALAFKGIGCLPKSIGSLTKAGMHRQVQYVLWFHCWFCGCLHIASAGNVEVMADRIAFIFAFDAEMVAGHVHLFGFGTGFYAVKRNENRPDLECLNG
jgi:hypothetical protein